MSSAARIRAMGGEDLVAVLEIEAHAHPSPWTQKIFEEELVREWARLMVVQEGPLVVGFCNYWLVHDEVHLLNIAVHPDHRRKGYGQLLVSHILDFGRQHGCRYVTLEVRQGNAGALVLYQANGFRSVGIRPAYYADNKEDAVVMVLDFEEGQAKPGSGIQGSD